MFKDLDEQYAFEKWAFGETPFVYSWFTMHTWNSRHGRKYFIKDTDSVRPSMKKMLTIYRKYMDKQINKVKKDVEKNDKPKAKKDIKKLLKMDKKFDAKLEKCGIDEKGKKK